jgi:hypothetical protein
MANNGCGQLGAIQTQGTCWFYSILNGFILSEDGQKILYAMLREFHNKLTEDEKSYFNSNINAPCPLKDLTKTKQIYFWKFVDQYLCFMSGPRSKSLQMGKSANLLGGMSLTGSVAREKKGVMGGRPHEEITKILGHIGFKEMSSMFPSWKDFLVVDFDDSEKVGKLKFDHRKKPKFIIVKRTGDRYMESATPAFIVNDPEYALMCTSITIGNRKAKSTEMHKYHAVAGYTCGGNGYIYDSNQKKIFKCDYWQWPKLKNTLDKNVGSFYSFFNKGQINYYGISFHVLARKDYVKHIAPACLMKYKAKTPEGFNLTSPNLGSRINTMNWLKPARRAALKRAWARTEHRAAVYINKATFNSILAGAKNRNNAFGQFFALGNAGYKHRKENYMNFVNKLVIKFPKKKAAPVTTTSPSPRTKRANQVRANFNKYWSGLTSNNRQVVRNYIAAYKSPVPGPVPSPARVSLANAKRNVNALKTAKARKEYKRARAVNMGAPNWKELGRYIATKNAAARNARAAKKSVAKK